MASPADASSFTTSNPPVPRNTRGTIVTDPPIPTPTYGAGGSFSTVVSAHIAAPPDTVFAVLANHPRWPEWNRFVRKLTVTSSPPPAEADPGAGALETLIRADDGSTYLRKDMDVSFQVHLDPDDATTSREETMHVTRLETFDLGPRRGWRVAWTPTGYPGFALRAERVQEIVDDGKGGSEYTCWETMYGLMGPVVRLTVGGKLEKAFQIWTDDLKKRSEDNARAEGAPPPGE